jgi:hypothetical protein
VTRVRVPFRDLLPVVAATAVGVGIAWLDSRSTWDDTGVTAVSLVACSAIFAAMSGRRPWLIALAVGAWVPILEIRGPAGVASLAGFVFASIGAAIGYAVIQAARPRDEPTTQRH